MTLFHTTDPAAIWPHLLPSFTQTMQLAAVIMVAASFVVIGAGLRAVVSRGPLTGVVAGRPQADLLVGWGAVVSLFVLAGCFTDLAFSRVALVLVPWTALSAYWAGRKGALDQAGQWLKIGLLVLPLLAVTASLGPSENDDLSQWLPNLRYLLLVDHFPGLGRPVSDSAFPAYPYATAMVGYLVSLITGQIATTAVDQFNILLLIGLGLLISAQWGDGKPGWRRLALALGMATAFSPTFVARLVLSNYVDCATAVSLAFAVVLIWDLVARDDRPSPPQYLQAAVALAILILAKQANLVLLAASLGGIGLATLPHWRRGPRLGLPLLGAFIVYMAWRHVVSGMGGGEMPIAPFSLWQWHVMPETLANIVHVMLNKSGYFGLAWVMVAGALWWRRENPLVLVFALTFLGFTVFLSWVYLAVYIGYEGRSAASFWRYHTQLGALQMVALAGLLRGLAPKLPLRFTQWGGAALVIVLCLGPIVGIKHVRFDINPSKDHVQAVAQTLTPLIGADARLLVADPLGNGFFTNYVRWFMGFRSPVADGTSVFNPPNDTARIVAAKAISHIYAISSSPELESVLAHAVPPGGTSLFARQADGSWVQVQFWPFQGFARIDDYKY